MSPKVQGRVPTKWSDATAKHITERLRALEKAVAGGQDVFQSPAVPTFGSGTVTGGAGSGGGGGGGTSTGVTDHGALTGLLDSDHPQYIVHDERTRAHPHQHTSEDLVGLEHKFLRRLERSPPERHGHIVADVSDLRPDDEQFVLASRMFGG